MDELNRVLVRFFLVFICSATVDQSTSVGIEPHPLPDYADAENLRGDSSLAAVAFADPRSEAAGIGIAVGDRGALYRSIDQGETWKALPIAVDCRLLDVIWIGARSAVVVGGAYDAITQLSRGVVLVSRDAGASFREIKDHDLPLLRNLRLSENRSLVADGDWSHAQLSKTFVSRDGGQTWQGSTVQTEQFDPTNITTNDSQVQSATSFVRWQRITGSPAPVRDACRIAGDRLCAVGDHGLILISEDGGDSWQPRRGGGRHAAILFVAADGQSASWSLLGAESLQWRNRCVLLVEQPVGDSIAAEATDIQSIGSQSTGTQLSLGLIRQAAVMLGVASVDWFRGSDESIEPADLQARRWIAVHRPSVVVIDESVSDETRQAVLQAAASMGVGRVLKASRREHGGSLLHHNALLPRIGLLAADLILDAQHFVAPQQCEPSSLSLTRLYDSASSRIGGGGESIMSGLATSQVNQLSGIAKSISRHRLQVVQARMKQSQLIGQLVNVEISSSDDFRQALRQLMDQTATEDQLRMIWSILDQTRGTRFESLCLHEIAERFSDRSIGHWATVRINAYQTGAEQRLLRSMAVATTEISRATPGQAAIVALSPFQNMHSDSSRSVSESPFQPNAFQQSPVQQASAFIPVGVAGPEVVQASPNSQIAKPTSSVDLQLDLHPAVMLSRLKMTADPRTDATDTGVTTQADLNRIVQQGTADWKRLLSNSGSSNSGSSDSNSSDSSNIHDPHQVWVKRTHAPPHLDGKLNDPCWQSDQVAMNQGDFRLRFAIDQDYLYVAAVCSSDTIAKDSGHRSINGTARDQSLADVDHLRLRFDTDGDLWTSHWIEVTDSGRTRDSVDGDIRWQPTWYVDVDRTQRTVTFELAIRQSDLAGDPSDVDARWFVSAQTVLAGKEIAEPVFPLPSHWRSMRFEPPKEPQRHKLKPSGPIRLAPVESVP